MSVIHDAFEEFFGSTPVTEAINMSSTDPAFSFFRRKKLIWVLSHKPCDILRFLPYFSWSF